MHNCMILLIPMPLPCGNQNLVKDDGAGALHFRHSTHFIAAASRRHSMHSIAVAIRSCHSTHSIQRSALPLPAIATWRTPLPSLNICSFVLCCLFSFVHCLFVRLLVVCSTTSPAMADCYVPSSAFVRCSFSFFRSRLFVVRLSFVHSLFVCRSFVRHLFDHLTRHG